MLSSLPIHFLSSRGNVFCPFFVQKKFLEISEAIHSPAQVHLLTRAARARTMRQRFEQSKQDLVEPSLPVSWQA
jgi:hypothetical protein